MIKNLIIIENGEEMQCDTIEELVKILIDENFYNMSNNEKTEKMEMKAYANCIGNDNKVVQDALPNEIDGKLIIKDEITYILSLLITNKVIVLEKKDSDILTKSLNKNNIKANYIIVNTFAKELLKKYLEK